MWQTLVGEKHSEIAISLNNLGMTYSQLGNHEKALELKEAALNMRKELYGKKHPYIANSLSNLSNTYEALGEYDKAIEKRSEAFEMRLELFGENHHHTISTGANLIKNYAKFGYDDDAEILAVRLRQFVPRDHRDRKLFDDYSTKYFKKKGVDKRPRGEFGL
jgi:tetratricopeptide (TPR) repeat protein